MEMEIKMSDSMIAVTYKYRTRVADRVATCCGMDSELTGTYSMVEAERTIVVPALMCDLLIRHDLGSRGELVGEIVKRPVSATYPAPYYWG